MTQPELMGLKAWAKHKESQGRYVVLCDWITKTIDEEINRRDSNGLQEPGMIEIPPWQPQQLADCLLGAFVLSRSGLTMQQGRFVDEALMMLIVDAHCVLGELPNTVRVVTTEGE
jgi:hypothetical protein